MQDVVQLNGEGGKGRMVKGLDGEGLNGEGGKGRRILISKIANKNESILP